MSSERLEILRRRRELHRQLATLSLEPLMRGSIYQRRRRCGRQSCACATDPNALHTSTFLTVFLDGRTRGFHSRAGDPRKAIEHLARFAEASLAGHALAEAAEALREALDHADRLLSPGRERSRGELLLRLAVALSELGRTAEVLDLLGGERENVERLHEPRLTGPYYCQLALAYSYLGEPERARTAARRAVGEAARCGDEPIIGRAQFASAGADWGLGQSRAAMENARHAVLCLTRVGDSHWLARSRRILGLARFAVGDFDGALEGERPSPVA